VVLALGGVHAQRRHPVIDFQAILDSPDLLNDFEIRYATTDADGHLPDKQLLTIHGDREMSLTTWRPGNPGSLAPVCISTLDESPFRKLLELMRDTDFSQIRGDRRQVRQVVNVRQESSITVRVGKLRVTKLDEHDPDRPHPELNEVEAALDKIKDRAGSGDAKCSMQAVPANP